MKYQDRASTLYSMTYANGQAYLIYNIPRDRQAPCSITKIWFIGESSTHYYRRSELARLIRGWRFMGRPLVNVSRAMYVDKSAMER